MESSPSAFIKILNSSFTFLKDYGELIGALIASSVALFLGGGGGNWIKTLFSKPALKVLSLKRLHHTHELDVWRVLIKNEGKAIARNVQVEVVEIIDDSNKKRENFLPLPLRWTHLDTETRDILPSQTAYLDIFEHINRGKQLTNMEHYLRFGSRFATQIADFCFLKPGESNIKIRLLHDEGGPHDIKIFTNWDGTLLFDSKIESGKWAWGKQEKYQSST